MPTTSHKTIPLLFSPCLLFIVLMVSVATPRLAHGGHADQEKSGGFSSETQVLMADGMTKPMAEIEVGDTVASWNFEMQDQTTATVQYVYTVVRDHAYLVNGIGITGEQVVCTAPGQFTEVRHLAPHSPIGDVSRKFGLAFAPVQEFRRTDKRGGVFRNIMVDGTHIFLVESASGSSILVHNKGGY